MGGRHTLLFHPINQLILSTLQRKSGSETEKYVTKKISNTDYTDLHGFYKNNKEPLIGVTLCEHYNIRWYPSVNEFTIDIYTYYVLPPPIRKNKKKLFNKLTSKRVNK